MSEPTTQADRREAVVRAHMASENEGDFEATLATFGHPRYELVGTSEVFDGHDDVMSYFETSRRAFPDQRNEIRSLRRTDDAIIMEFDLLGTHQGRLRDWEPTGRTFRCPMAAFFAFEGDGIVCERVYFNPGAILGQLGLT